MKKRTMLLSGAAWAVLGITINTVTALWLGLPTLFTAPVTEEVVRAGVAATLAPRATRAQAAAIGAIGGTLELIWKVLASPMDSAAVSEPAYFLSFAVSLPIHIALSTTYYAFERHRLLKNIGLHLLFNLTLYGLASNIIGKVSPYVYSATTVGLALALCAVILAVSGTFRKSRET
jgi:hypothetical protein